MMCDKLPNLEYLDDYKDWKEYQDALYEIFSNDFKRSQPLFLGLKVFHRKFPMEYEKEEAFFHITCKDYENNRDRNPDMRRCERIRWVRYFIDNWEMCRTRDISCDDCEGIKAWFEERKTGERAHILLEEERYIVVVELRDEYCLLITAFYIEYDHMLNKYYKRYQKSKKRLL